jgi:D-serine deaminase-like pyridoxal phosphate-dependent protein
MASSLYPISSANEMKKRYVGQNIRDLPSPGAIVDIAKVKSNCKMMLDAVTHLGLSFRAHIKTHKTPEITRFQVGKHSKDVRLVVSTIAEAEMLVPLLLEYISWKAKVNIVYGVPIGLSQVARLAAVAQQLGPGSITFMVDNTAQLSALENFRNLAGFPALVFLKTDSGYHRAGLAPLSGEMIGLVKEVSAWESKGILRLLGFYSHNSLSYGGSSPDEAMAMLKLEIDVCRQATQHLKSPRSQPLVISVGASPTALSIQNVLPSISSRSSSAEALKEALELTTSNFEIEIHAGVYPLFDLQQVAASSRAIQGDPHDVIGVTVLAEVCSLYPTRTEKPEALVSAGCLALAREPCKSYSGWGVVSKWGMPDMYSTAVESRIIVSRISQEHGILGYEAAGNTTPLPLEYGQKVRIWPNHACITLAMFGWYYIVDSSSGSPDTVIDVWTRGRGW